ncbi:MAG: hypothetical protein SOV73_04610 [Candidatus Faecivivens sp.]|nr:hypothetical protein [Candidatus Faecivivens sp.]
MTLLTVLSGPEYRFTYPNGDQIRQLPPLESRAAQVIRCNPQPVF